MYPNLTPALSVFCMPGIRAEEKVAYAASPMIPPTTKNMIVLPKCFKKAHHANTLRSKMSMVAARSLKLCIRREI